MGLDFGWEPDDTRETIWKGDGALRDVPAGVLKDWETDGDASHLRPYATAGKPEVFTFRSLTVSESRFVLGLQFEMPGTAGFLNAITYCFRLGVSFPHGPETVPTADGQKHETTEREGRFRLLSERFVTKLERRYPGIVAFYGHMIYAGTIPSDAEKKASSLPSTPTQSSAAATTPVDTAAVNGAAQPAA